MGDPVASLSISEDFATYVSPRFGSRDSTSRPSMVIVIGASDEIRLVTERGAYTGRCLLVSPNVSRSIEVNNATGLYSIQLDPASRLSQYLRRHVPGEKPVVDLSKKAEGFALETSGAALGKPPGDPDIAAASQRVLDALFGDAVAFPATECRVQTVAGCLKARVPVRTDPRSLARLCGISESRLVHLFASVTGVSIREYLLWVKARKAVSMFASGKTLTEVAHATSFSDQAHLSRTFKRYFGLTPSFLSNPRLVRISNSATGCRAEPDCGRHCGHSSFRIADPAKLC
ncbi:MULTISPECIES: helix-turn-helix transcriptional regulator [Burkholderia cepacia complex]|uniref:AraC family transcriptional regulator n=2 Tax=Burkholderia cepacia complex TaxID=87882 RepID=A0A0H3KYV1_BURM1|nr:MULTISPECIES: helix-turn-helix transcriptional regulator [Burkholderia cepacia complex]ABX19417.1 transcriptional regulator, AraC family [Burkholderia multivorans ATCC 17616]AIO71508.1 helix-turn-helix domain protein [Burkholderia multivorans]MBR7913780.1 helix-turn-helix transcriptional regulator [Burkholderia vietnamiensis]MBU9146971.1 helix-turn-helix transcriptional regulator [Burkholderia multivorans]MBU9202568.1 helix-turn-helix transcriptional regulator [Burkholderia multivorans]